MIKTVNVFINHIDNKLFVGKLALKNRKIYFEYDLDLLLRRYNVKNFIGLYSLDGNQIDSMMTCSKDTAKIMLSMGLNHLGKGD